MNNYRFLFDRLYNELSDVEKFEFNTHIQNLSNYISSKKDYNIQYKYLKLLNPYIMSGYMGNVDIVEKTLWFKQYNPSDIIHISISRSHNKSPTYVSLQ